MEKTSLATKDITTLISQTDWFQNLNKYSSEISKAMDENFLKEGISKLMTPLNHRIVDGGHDFFSTINKAQEIGKQNEWDSLKTFQEWAASYFTDLSSNAGMPIFGKFSEVIYSFLLKLNISETFARDFVTVNGQEAIDSILAGSVSTIALVFGWKSEDKESFSRVLGGIMSAGVITMNPASLIVAIVALAFGYNKLVYKEAVARGAIVSSTGLFISTIIPGPVLIGLIPAIVISIYLYKKMGTEIKPLEYTSQIISLIQSEEFKKTCLALYEELKDKVRTS